MMKKFSGKSKHIQCGQNIHSDNKIYTKEAIKETLKTGKILIDHFFGWETCAFL